MSFVKNNCEDNHIENISLESQSHPGLSPASPFEILTEYGRGPQENFCGDVHYCLQLSIVLAGEVEILCQGVSRICRKNEMWWTMCWEKHAYKMLGKRNLILSVNINIDSLGETGPYSGTDYLLPFTSPFEERYSPGDGRGKEQISKFSRQLLKLNSERPAFWQDQCWMLIHLFILQAARQMNRAGNIEHKTDDTYSAMTRITPAVTAVHSEAIPPPLKKAASRCHLSPSRFSVLFTSAMGVSYGQFALRVRIVKAARDVQSGQFTLNEIALRHGFCDASSFCNAFKKLYGCTPHEFKMRDNTKKE